MPLFQRHSEGYVITSGPVGNGGWEAKRLADPVLRWWQPVRGGDDGALYLWVRAGRPVAAITFFTFKWPDGNRSIVHERHSFAPDPLEATWRDKTVWQTSEPGLTFRPVADAPAPAPTAAGRLRQMQAIVHDVAATTTDDKSSTWQLRALAKPLYRYESETDGALFALAQGTDPEAFLFVEARGQGKEARWEMGVARFTDLKIQVRYKNAEIFSGPNTTGRADGIYHSTVRHYLAAERETPADFDWPERLPNPEEFR